MEAKPRQGLSQLPLSRGCPSEERNAGTQVTSSFHSGHGGSVHCEQLLHPILGTTHQVTSTLFKGHNSLNLVPQRLLIENVAQQDL